MLTTSLRLLTTLALLALESCSITSGWRDVPTTSRSGAAVTWPGGQVRTWQAGSGSGAPLIVVHGGPGLPHDYLENIGALEDERTVIFWDQLGCGQSQRPSNPALWSL